MNQFYDNKRILVIDYQPYWREFSTRVLNASSEQLRNEHYLL